MFSGAPPSQAIPSIVNAKSRAFKLSVTFPRAELSQTARPFLEVRALATRSPCPGLVHSCLVALSSMQLFVRSTQTHVLHVFNNATGGSLRQAVEVNIAAMCFSTLCAEYAASGLTDNSPAGEDRLAKGLVLALFCRPLSRRRYFAWSIRSQL